MDQADRRVKKLRCQFTAPPNRFGIPAGSRWDGKVQRGRGSWEALFGLKLWCDFLRVVV